MFFLLRMAFWLGIVLTLLPSVSEQRNTPGSDVSASEAVSAASATVQDLRGFCARQTEACSVGSQIAVAVGYRAQAGAKMLYDFLTEALAPRETGSLQHSAAIHGDAGKASADKSAADQASRSTLTPADLELPWRGPQSRKDAKPAA